MGNVNKEFNERFFSAFPSVFLNNCIHKILSSLLLFFQLKSNKRIQVHKQIIKADDFQSKCFQLKSYVKIVRSRPLKDQGVFPEVGLSSVNHLSVYFTLRMHLVPF